MPPKSREYAIKTTKDNQKEKSFSQLSEIQQGAKVLKTRKIQKGEQSAKKWKNRPPKRIKYLNRTKMPKPNVEIFELPKLESLRSSDVVSE